MREKIEPAFESLKQGQFFERDWSNIHQEKFILHYFYIDWNASVNLDEQNVDYSTESFLNKIN